MEETRRVTTGRDPHNQDSYYIPEQILEEFQVHRTTATKSPLSPRDRQQQRRLTCEVERQSDRVRRQLHT